MVRLVVAIILLLTCSLVLLKEDDPTRNYMNNSLSNIDDITLIGDAIDYKSYANSVISPLDEMADETFDDAVEYNEITRAANNITRRFDILASIIAGFIGSYWYEDYYDLPGWNIIEKEIVKKRMLSNISLQFLYHARYKMQYTFKLRDHIKKDKRYMLGYLYNRLRRLKYDLLKTISHAVRQEATWYKHIRGLIRFYRRVVRIDVDIKDTIRHFKDIYALPDPMD